MSPLATNTLPRTVLLVDDEVLVRVAVAQQLRDCGYRVIEAAGADEALVVLRRPEIRLDVVLSDVEMPGTMDGFALAAWVRANRPDLKVMMAGTITRAVDAAIMLCEEGPLPGSYEPQNLLSRIKQLMARRAARRVVKSWRGLTTRMRRSAGRHS